MKTRILTVSFLMRESTTKSSGPVPFIRLSGRWLAEAAFCPGDSIRVDVEYGRLVISKLTPEGTAVPPGANPDEFGFMSEIGNQQRRGKAVNSAQ